MERGSKNIMVSVCMITYQHEEFIKQSIDGVLMQKTNFPIELIIGEDCSKDRTREICIEYQKQYPSIIKLRLPAKNQGPMVNWIANLKACEGKYIALCEGDDYWTDPNKLQKQVDFLEQHPDYSMSSHNSAILAHNKKLLYNPPLDQKDLNTTNLINEDWGIMTASIIFRRNCLTPVPNWFSNIKSGDYALQLVLSTKGKIHYIPEYMSVYRRHIGGLTAIFKPLYAANVMHDILKYFNEETHDKYKIYTQAKLNQMYFNNKKVAKDNGLRKEYILLSFMYYFSKIGIDIVPVISKIR